MEQRCEPRPPYHPLEVIREIWDRLPVWFLCIQAISLLHFIRASVPERMFAADGINRDAMCLTTIIPLSVVTIYYLLRAYRSKGLKSVPLTAAVVMLFTAGVPLLLYFTAKAPPREVSDQQIVSAYEYGQLLWFFIFFAHIWAKKGWPGLVLYWVVALSYGIILENAGIVLGYFFEGNFRHYIYRLPAPVCTMCGWVLVMYVCTSISEEFAKLLPEFRWTPLRVALVTTGVALALDLQVDPMASLSGIWWKWNSALPPRWFGVPAVNYVAWFSAVLPFAYWLQRIQQHEEWTPMLKNKQLFLHLHVILIVGGFLNFGIMALYETVCGHAFLRGPTFQILHQFLNRILPYG